MRQATVSFGLVALKNHLQPTFVHTYSDFLPLLTIGSIVSSLTCTVPTTDPAGALSEMQRLELLVV